MQTPSVHFYDPDTPIGEIFYPKAELRGITARNIQAGFLAFKGRVEIENSTFEYIFAKRLLNSGGVINNHKTFEAGDQTAVVQLHGSNFLHVGADEEGGAVYSNVVNATRCSFEFAKAYHGICF